MSAKTALEINIKNILGKKTNRKLVVIYADDYGGIRVRDKNAHERLLKAGIAVDKTRYGYDTVCTSEDLHKLFDVLTSVKDLNGHHACFTPFANIANPDFEKIRASGFRHYYREPFTATIDRLGAAYTGVYDLWKQGISEGIFIPEYHGTEHINVRRFMSALQNGHKSTMLAFENESVCVPHLPGESPVSNDTAVFDIEHTSDNEPLMEDIKVGLTMFERFLGYRSCQFTPGAGIYSPLLHKTLSENGIKSIHVNRWKAYPLGDGVYSRKFLYTGKKNESGQYYIVRNCPFEPFFDNMSRNNNAVATCLENIATAFRWHAPALVSTHRVNFAGAIESSHREESLTQLSILLHEIIKLWPDAEFVSGRDMANALFE